MGLLDGKVAVITGAGRGIGRTEALLLASEGASVVVNDVGAAVTGEGSEQRPAQEVVDEIKAAGGTAAATNTDTPGWGAGHPWTNQPIGDPAGSDTRGTTAATWAPENTAALVGWLASDLSRGVTGQVFIITAGVVQVAQGWRPIAKATSDKPWTIDDIEGVREQLFAEADPGVPPFLM